MALDDINIFVKVVECASLSGAARRLDLPKSTVSRRLTALEARLGVRLIHRSTRNLKLTALGEEYYRNVAHLIAVAEEAEQRLRDRQDNGGGVLRITLPVEFAMFQLRPMLNDFLETHPEITLDIHVSDEVRDIIEEGFDIAIRAGKLDDSRLVSRKLGDSEFRLYATQNYLRVYGEPCAPLDLARHMCNQFAPLVSSSGWRLFRHNQITNCAVNCRLSVNNVSLLLERVLAHGGIGMLPSTTGERLVTEGKLTRVLPEWTCGSSGVYFIYPSRKFAPAKVRLFMDFMKRRI